MSRKYYSQFDILVLSFWFEVTLMHIPYTAEFMNRNERIELAFKQVAYGILYSFMLDKWVR